jgi:Sec-independent protein translocase protein TatA
LRVGRHIVPTFRSAFFYVWHRITRIVVGPEKLPDLAKTIAKQVLELKKAANELKNSLKDEMDDQEKKPFQTVDQEKYLPEKLAAQARQVAKEKEEETAAVPQKPESEEQGGSGEADKHDPA